MGCSLLCKANPIKTVLQESGRGFKSPLLVTGQLSWHCYFCATESLFNLSSWSGWPNERHFVCLPLGAKQAVLIIAIWKGRKSFLWKMRRHQQQDTTTKSVGKEEKIFWKRRWPLPCSCRRLQRRQYGGQRLPTRPESESIILKRVRWVCGIRWFEWERIRFWVQPSCILRGPPCSVGNPNQSRAATVKCVNKPLLIKVGASVHCPAQPRSCRSRKLARENPVV